MLVRKLNPNKKEMIARALKVGKNRIWIDPSKKEEVEKAVTRRDIRELLAKKIIKVKKKKGVSRARARLRHEQKKKGRRRGHGKRKGAKGARIDKKRAWINKVRAQRKLLKEYKGKIDSKLYREIYSKIKGNFFRSRAHLKMYIEKVLSK